jgi:hypothetical protein
VAAVFIGAFSQMPSASAGWLTAKMAVAAVIVALLAWKGRFLESAGTSRLKL